MNYVGQTNGNIETAVLHSIYRIYIACCLVCRIKVISVDVLKEKRSQIFNTKVFEFSLTHIN